MRTLVLLALVGLGAQLVDGSLGMAYGVTSSTLLLTVGLAPASVSATVHLAELGAEITPFTARHFGAAYPYGNKIEALEVLPAGEPFLFFDSDTLVTGPLDRLDTAGTQATASMRRGPTWPRALSRSPSRRRSSPTSGRRRGPAASRVC